MALPIIKYFRPLFMRRSIITIIIFCFLAVSSAFAQDVNKLLREAIQLEQSLREADAFNKYKEILRVSPINMDALTKCSELSSRIGNRQPTKAGKQDYFRAAQTYAELALRVNANNADANFVMAMAMGRKALTESGKARVAAVKDIKRYADAALRINPNHSKAWHVIGKWNYEVSSLSSVERAAAKVLFGGLPKASIAEAVRAYEKAQSLDPKILLNYLELAKAYKKNGQKAQAIAAINKMLPLPNTTEDDDRIKSEGRQLLNEWK